MVKIPDSFLEQLPKLGFGFALGAGLGGIIYMILYFYTKTDISPMIFFYTGGAIGLAINILLDKLINFMIFPITRTLRFYFSITEILLSKLIGLMSPEDAKKILRAKFYARHLRACKNLRFYRCED